MNGLLERIIAIFQTPAGLTVLMLAGLAFIGLLVFVFWDAIRLPRRDETDGAPLETAPPPLLSPSVATRSPGTGRGTGQFLILRNALLLAIGAGLVFGGLSLVEDLPEEVRQAALPSKLGGAADRPPETPSGAASPAPETHLSRALPFCEEGGSVSERYFEVCARGASVRFDLLRLTHQGRFLVRPAWHQAAPTFVTSDSHAAPVSFGDGIDLAQPATVAGDRYDAFLVIGTEVLDLKEQDVTDRMRAERAAKRNSVDAAGFDPAEVELTEAERADIVAIMRAEAKSRAMARAEARAEALRDFAVSELSGGDRSECATGERVYAVAALFESSTPKALEADRSRLASLFEGAGHRDAKAVADLAAEEAALRRAELEVLEAPGPILVGIKSDPMSSDPDADMRAAVEKLLERRATALQISAPTPAAALDACARGRPSL